MLLRVEVVIELLDSLAFVLASPQIVGKETFEAFSKRLNRISQRIEAIPRRRGYNVILGLASIVTVMTFVYKWIFYNDFDLPEYIWIPFLVFAGIAFLPEYLGIYADGALAISESLFAAGALVFFLARGLSIAHAVGYNLPWLS